MSSPNIEGRVDHEEAIRAVLIARRAHEYAHMMSDREIQKGLEQQIYAETAAELGPKEASSGQLEYTVELVRAHLFDPRQIQAQAHQDATNQYKEPERAREELESKLPGPELEGFRNAMEPLYGYLSHTREVVSRLTEIAEQEGLETALAAETEHRVLRTMFPTAQAYVDHALQPVRAGMDYLTLFAEAAAAERTPFELRLVQWVQPLLQRAAEEKASVIYKT